MSTSTTISVHPKGDALYRVQPYPDAPGGHLGVIRFENPYSSPAIQSVDPAHFEQLAAVLLEAAAEMRARAELDTAVAS